MKTMLIIGLALAPLLAQAEDWTVAGKTYQNVVVGKVEADCVHITYATGLGSIPIASLPTDLQKKFHYDPLAAKAAIDAKERARQTATPAPRPIIEEGPDTDAPKAPQVDVADTRAKIAAYQADIDEKTLLDSRGKRVDVVYLGNGYKNIIEADKRQIAILTAQLRGAASKKN